MDTNNRQWFVTMREGSQPENEPDHTYEVWAPDRCSALDALKEQWAAERSDVAKVEEWDGEKLVRDEE